MAIRSSSCRRQTSLAKAWIQLAIAIVLISVIYSHMSNPPIQVGLDENGIGIARIPKPDPSHGRVRTIDSLPPENALGVINLVRTDLRKLDLGNSGNLLLSGATYDSGTRWPSDLPEGFNPGSILDEGRNPGLGVRELHKKGITGNGVSVGIIDQTLLIDHEELGGRVKHYEEIDANPTTELHCAVAGIAVGANTGVAPLANLYYIATNFAHEKKAENLAKALDRFVEINSVLPEDEQIEVISISASWRPGDPGYELADAAAKRAKEKGIFVICSVVEEYYDLKYHGLGRAPGSDPDDPRSYEPGFWWAEDYESWYPSGEKHDRLLVPMDSRTVTGWFDRRSYVFDRHAGWSWCAPWIAGLYALAIQTDPHVTPSSFYEAALDTAFYVPLTGSDSGEILGPIVNPVGLIEQLRSGTEF